MTITLPFLKVFLPSGEALVTPGVVVAIPSDQRDGKKKKLDCAFVLVA